MKPRRSFGVRFRVSCMSYESVELGSVESWWEEKTSICETMERVKESSYRIHTYIMWITSAKVPSSSPNLKTRCHVLPCRVSDSGIIQTTFVTRNTSKWHQIRLSFRHLSIPNHFPSNYLLDFLTKKIIRQCILFTHIPSCCNRIVSPLELA